MAIQSLSQKKPAGPVRVAPLPFEPQLKNSVDSQLQYAFHDETWNTVANLSRQRHRTSRDPYYLALEMVAKSRSEVAVDRYQGLSTVQKMVADEVIPKDVDMLDLYEFACSELDYDYEQTIGTLRMRLVKALPKDERASVRCFEACIWNSDWTHAQQIVASLDKNFPKESKYHFRNIMVTFLYTMAPASPADKAQLFLRLSKMTVDKAFNLRKEGSADRAVQSDEQLWLWQRIAFSDAHEKGRLDQILAQLDKQDGGLLSLVTADHPFSEILSNLKRFGAWNTVGSISQRLITRAAELAEEQALAMESADGEEAKSKVKEIKSKMSDLDTAIFNRGTYSRTWSDLIEAAGHHPSPRQELEKAWSSIKTIMAAMQRCKIARLTSRKSFDQLDLRIAFEPHMRPTDESIGNGSRRLLRLFNYLEKYYRAVSVFEDVREVAAKLELDEVAQLLQLLFSAGAEADNEFKALAMTAMRLKFRYFFATGQQSAKACQFCNAPLQDSDCRACLRVIARGAVENFAAGFQNSHLMKEVLPREDVDPLSDLTAVGASCLLNLAKAGGQGKAVVPQSPLANIDAHYHLKAVAWLETYVSAVTKTDSLRMLLVKLYVQIGCISRAKQLWEPFAIKNAVLNPLAGLFFDRISTVSPKYVLLHTRSSPNVVVATTSFIEHAITRVYPKQIRLAIECDSYSTVEELHQSSEKQKLSCTLAMAVVEGRRAARFRVGKNEEPIDTIPLVANITTEHVLHDTTDYSCLPQFSHTSATPIQDMVHTGPAFTNTRAQASLIAERFFDLIAPATFKDYKPTKAAAVQKLDLVYAAERSQLLGLQLDDFLRREDEARTPSFTGSEARYFEALAELIALLHDVVEMCVEASAPSKTRKQGIEAATKGVVERVNKQREKFVKFGGTNPAPFTGFATLHAMGMLHDTALATRLCAGYLGMIIKLAPKPAEVAWVGNQMKMLTSAAGQADDCVKTRMKGLKEFTTAGGWVQKVKGWAFPGKGGEEGERNEDDEKIEEILKGEVVGEGMERWATGLVMGWRETVDGWTAVKLD